MVNPARKLVGQARCLTGTLFLALTLALTASGDEKTSLTSSARFGNMQSRDVAQKIATGDDRLYQPPELVIPPIDLAAAELEVEPNNTIEEAQVLDGARIVRGTFEAKDYDFFSFQVVGEPQLWYVEAEGEKLSWLRYIDAEGTGIDGVTPTDHPSRHIFSKKYLFQGRHHLAVHGNEGSDYTLRLVPLGPPDPRDELEPNGDATRAHRLQFGISRSGHFSDYRDADYYYFSIGGREQVIAQVTPPAGVTTRMRLELRAASSVEEIVRVEGKDEPIVYRCELYPGDYSLVVSSIGGDSQEGYGVRIDRMDPFDLPADKEPNDTIGQASPLPPDLVAQGELSPHDYDWYQLPIMSTESRFSVTPDAATGEQIKAGLRARLFDANEKALKDFSFDRDTGTYTGTLPANTPSVLRLYRGNRYHLTFAFDSGPTSQQRSTLPVNIALPETSPVIAAYWHQGQQVSIPVNLVNTSNRETQLRLNAVSGHHAWRPELENSSVTLAAGQEKSIKVNVHVAPDARADAAVNVTVRAQNTQLATQTASLTLNAMCGAPPVQPSQVWPLPDALLGGFNVVATALGAPDGEASYQVKLQDGFTPNDREWRGTLPVSLQFSVAGESAVAIAGFVLNPKGTGLTSQRARDFEIEASLDGDAWSKVLEARLGSQSVEQSFVLPAPVDARFLKLTIKSSHAGPTGRVNLGEFKAISVPGRPLGPQAMNLADPRHGGFVVWSEPLIGNPSSRILQEDSQDVTVRLIAGNPGTWVTGFHNNRAAQITGLQWLQPPSIGFSAMSKVQVSVSTDDPLGPWTPLGEWSLDTEAGSTSILEFDEPVWARYLRLTHNEATELAYWHLPAALRVIERQADSSYRSILGEWGHYTRPAIYEQLVPPAVTEDALRDVDDGTRQKAQAIALGRSYRDSVLVGEDEDWYRIVVPAGDNRLRLDIHDVLSLRARFELVDNQGRRVEVKETHVKDIPRPVFEANVTGGESYFLHLDEPKRSIAFVWDNSGSVGPYKATIYQAMSNFSHGILPGREAANLLPFSETGRLLRKDWAEHPRLLQETLNNYDRSDHSSNAEYNLNAALRHMIGRDGTKAVILLTDAASGGYKSTPVLWNSIAEVEPRIFTLELHSGNVAGQQDLMQTWASAGHGVYDYFSSNADLQVGFERAACHIRRPAGYTLTATTRSQAPLEPGFLTVASEDVIAQGAIELILDASGSMLQRLNGRRRIEIAREVLTDLVTNTLPAGTLLAMRIFGHRTPDACQTDLEVPVAPLDPAKVAKVIAQTNAKNLAKTPIAKSLALVADDLREVGGQKLIILITDGEETCDGDPDQSIEALKEAGFEVRINIIGFAIDDEVLKSDFERWARTGGGRYFDASGAEELSRAVEESIKPKFQVTDATGDVIAEGTVNGDRLQLPVGKYTVKVLANPLRIFEDVSIDSGQERALSLTLTEGPADQ